MRPNTILFGVDLLVFGLAFTKLLSDKLSLEKGTADLIRASFAALAVLAVGLNGMGYIPVTAEPWFVLVSNVIAVFLTMLGYLPEATGLLNAWSDRVRVRTYTEVARLTIPAIEGADNVVARMKAQKKADDLAARYRLTNVIVRGRF